MTGLLVATALPALLWLRGCFVLHASCAVGADGRAVAFAGASGAGKSLLAAALVRQGWSLVGDDTVTLADHGDRMIAAGLSAGQFIATAAAAALKDRPYAVVPPAQRRSEAPLRAICMLRPAEGARPHLARLDPVAAVAALLANRHRPAVPRGLRAEGRSLEQAGRAADLVPLYSLDFDPARLDPKALISLLSQA